MNGRIWYCVNKIGMATACNDEQDALETAAEAEKDWPHMMPHRVMRLVDAAELDELKAENARLRAELEAVGAGGVQPLRAKAGWVLVPVERARHWIVQDFSFLFPTEDAAKRYLENVGADASPTACYTAPQQAAPQQEAAAAAADAAPQQATPVPPQKPELRVGQVWLTRGGCRAKIEAEMKNLPYPFRCASGDDQWTVTEAGRYYYRNIESRADLIELITDVQKGGEA